MFATLSDQVGTIRVRRWAAAFCAVLAALFAAASVGAETIIIGNLTDQLFSIDALGNPTAIPFPGAERLGVLKLDASGNIFAIDYGPSGADTPIRVFKRTASDTFLFATLPGDPSYNGMAIADDGAVFLSVNVCPGDCHHEIWQLRPGDSPLVVWSSGSEVGPYGITFGPGGHLYFVETGGDFSHLPRVVRLTRSGVASEFFPFPYKLDVEGLSFDSQGRIFMIARDRVMKLEAGSLDLFLSGFLLPEYPLFLTITPTDVLFLAGDSGVERVTPAAQSTVFFNQFGARGLDDDAFDTFPAVFCGDSLIAGGEGCDDGNQMAGDGCSASCSCEGTCGNGTSEPPCESCDDGDLIDGNGCDSNCTPTACGNGILTALEQCDDGNTIACDGCSPTCQTEVGFACGDAAVSAACGEQCDDGNQLAGDGCSASCQEQAAADSSSATVSAGGTLTTDSESDGATSSDPLETSVTSPGGGAISISEASGVSAGQGFEFVGQAATISAPAATAANPLVIVLRLDASRIPLGQTQNTLVLLRNGAAVTGCTGAPGTASPDPCVASRVLLGDGDVEITALTSTASVWGLALPAHDSIVLPPKPIVALIPSGASSVGKKLKVQVLNADVLPAEEQPGHAIQLIATDGDCPSGTVAGLPDFDLATGGAQDSVLLAGGGRAIATVPLTIAPSAFTTFNSKAPQRCRLRLRVSAVEPGNNDPSPTNDETTVELNVIDGNDPAQTQAHESVIASLVPVKLKLRAGKTSVLKKLAVKVANADIGETPGHSIKLVAEDGDCPPGTVGVPDFTPVAGIVDTVTIAGAAKRVAKVAVTATAAGFTSRNGSAPMRCTALLRAVGPSGDTDITNNTTQLLIDVVDENDF